MDAQQRNMVPMRRLEGRPGSAQGMDAQQRSMAPMSVYKDKEVQKVAATVMGERQDFSNGGAVPDPKLAERKEYSPGMEEQSEDIGNASECSSCKSEEQKLEEVLQTQASKLEDEINDIKKTGAGRMARVFKLKQKIVGNRKVGQEPTAIKDPKTEDLLVSNSDIRRTSLNYCVNNLKNKEVVDNVKVIVSLKENLHNMRMKEDTKDEFEVELDEYEAVLDKFKRKDTKSYDFLVKAATNYQGAIGRFVKRMIEEEIFPEEFRRTTLQMLWKGKGTPEVLKNSRFLHLKSFLPRACEAVVVNRMKDKILENSSVFQVGGQPGHSTDESIFIVKSIMALAEASGRSFLFSLVDIIGFFDNEQILDVMDCLDKAGVSKKAAKCWFKLNENTEIRVNTAAGMTAAAEAGDLVGQGTAGAGLVSQLSLDTGLQQYFSGSGDELYYGGLRIEYTAYREAQRGGQGGPDPHGPAGLHAGGQGTAGPSRQDLLYCL